MAKQLEEIHNFKHEGPPGYYTRLDNRPPFSEKKPSLEELMNKHIIEQLAKDYQAKAANEVLDYLNFCAMADLGASVNMMPKLMFNHLQLSNLIKTDMLVEMADMTKRLLPFLATIHARIDVFAKKISLGVRDDMIVFYMNGIRNDPYSRILDEYKAMFDNEIEQLANEYELRIGTKGQEIDNPPWLVDK
ncbi:hypothetical protein Tco_0967733 [Tanacetum coccineum]